MSSNDASDAVIGEGRRRFRAFSFKGAHYRYSSSHPYRSDAPVPDLLPRRLRSLRLELERYIGRFPEFGRSLAPLGCYEPLPYDPPESALRMQHSSLATLALSKSSASAGADEGVAGIAPVGPMAAVAGTFAELGMESALSAFGDAGADPADADVVVENGGDIAMQLNSPLYAALFVGPDSPFSDLAFRFRGDGRRKAVCSSSGRLGHSLSFGSCELAAVFSSDAALADAAATALCNSIHSPGQLEERLNEIITLEGIDGAVAVLGRHFGRAGEIPELVRHRDPELGAKISRDPNSFF